MNQTNYQVDFRPYQNSLAAKAFSSLTSRGRRFPCISEDAPMAQVIDPYLMDTMAILNSKAFRRLPNVTQVFPSDNGNNNIRNRFVHTNEVVALAIEIASILGLNIPLVEAIAFGHDIGHVSFGHLGEKVISEISGLKFRHEIMSVIVAQKIERGGLGLNLSWETLNGIVNHSRGKNDLQVNVNLPLEYAVIMFSDKIAYTFSDFNDALRFGFLTKDKFPSEFYELGKNQRESWQKCVYALVKESSEKGFISFSESHVAQKFETLRQWSYENFYSKLDLGKERQQTKKDFMIAHDFLENWLGKEKGHNHLLALALLTDNEVKRIVKLTQYPRLWNANMFDSFSFFEILTLLPKEYKINIFEADLNVENFSNELGLNKY